MSAPVTCAVALYPNLANVHAPAESVEVSALGAAPTFASAERANQYRLLWVAPDALGQNEVSELSRTFTVLLVVVSVDFVFRAKGRPA